MSSIIGLDIGASKVSGGVVRQQKLLRAASSKIDCQATLKKTLQQIKNLLDGLITEDVKAIGVGAPGIVDMKQGIVFEAANIPSWKKVPLKKILQTKYKVPVFVDNDANCFALGEKHFGRGKNYQNIAAVTLGSGLGTGLIINGKIYRGSHGAAGEFGQTIYQKYNLEHYAAGQFFTEEYQTNGEELFVKAKTDEKRALAIFEEFGWHLGKALSAIVYAFDPEIIILGGSISKAFRFFEKAMRRSLRESSYQRTYRYLKIVVSNNPASSLLGAAFFASQNL